MFRRQLFRNAAVFVVAAATGMAGPTPASRAFAQEVCTVPPSADLNVVDTVYEVGVALHVSDKVMLAGFEAGWVESHMNNLPCGDLDSIGVFQQRPSQGWGSVEQIMDVEYASRSFFQLAITVAAENPNHTPGQVAQDVQRSRFPDRYDAAEGTARSLLEGAEGRHQPAVDVSQVGVGAVQWGENLNVYSISRFTGNLYQRGYVPGSGWTDWANLGGNFTGRPVPVVYRGALNLYAISRNSGNLYQRSYTSTGGWSQWLNLGGEFSGSPAVAQWGENLNVYAVSRNAGHIYQRAYAPGSGWTTWAALGNGQFAGSPSVVVFNGTLHVYGISNGAGYLYRNVYTGAWSGWQTVGTGQFLQGSTPAVVQWKTALNVYAISAGSGYVYQNAYRTETASWTGWSPLGTGQFAGSPNTVEFNNALNIYAISPTGVLYQNAYKDNTWTGWTGLGGEMTGRPLPVVYRTNLNLYTISRDSGVLYQRAYVPGTGWTTWNGLA